MTHQQIKTGVFSDHEIREALKDGQIIISPFRDSQLNTSSYDVTLGEQFYVCQADDFQTDFNPYDKKDVERYYKGPLHAITNKEWCEEHRGGKLWKNIPAKQKIIVLKPGECILSHTQEFIGAVHHATTMMHARSSIGRVNISTCDDAGWGDIGYFNRWTMEVRNKNKIHVPIPVGECVGQIIFFHAGQSDRHYGLEGRYQKGTELRQLTKNWVPELMLPKLYERKRG